MKGRQKLFKADQHFKVSKADESLLELRDFLGVHMINGDLREFQTSWDSTIAAMEPPPEETLCLTLYHQETENNN